MVATSVLFHADARHDAGGGHVSRCINLARALRPSCHVSFALSGHAAPHWRERLHEFGIGINDDVRGKGVIAVLDGYELGPRDVANRKRETSALVMIEDLGRRFAGVDLYVSFAGPPPAGGRVLSGPRYALLGPHFARGVSPRGMGGILVSCGLRDSADVTGRYLEALTRCSAAGAITVVLGKAAPHRKKIERQTRELRGQVLFDVSDMASFYDDADLVLGSGGVSLFERMARGRASITLVAAENQAFSAAQMAKLGSTLLAGDVKDADAATLAKSIDALLDDSDARAKMGALARQAVDGLGAERTAREIIALAAAVASRASVNS